jgi:hypothetical protein
LTTHILRIKLFGRGVVTTEIYINGKLYKVSLPEELLKKPIGVWGRVRSRLVPLSAGSFLIRDFRKYPPEEGLIFKTHGAKNTKPKRTL